MNRPREKAVYITPEDAWGLQVWASDPQAGIIEQSHEQYDAFYEAIDQIIEDKIAREGQFFLFDLHTYNHRRDGSDGPVADPEANPEVNIGTGTLDRDRWGHVVDRFIDDLRAADFQGRHLDVRENVKIKGGNFLRHINEKFGEHGLAIAVEYKKFFMDEWTGQRDVASTNAIQALLDATVQGMLETLIQA
ncbi:MAG: N-formylglutamate amidohydrolase [Planctomycetota bacterium]|nr:N-formylglutamate amidohydrolase [Planctomycetota bacterium]